MKLLGFYDKLAVMLLRCLIFFCWTTSVLANPASPPLDVELSAVEISPYATKTSLRPSARTIFIPEARWGTSGGRAGWTLEIIKGLRSHASNIPEIVPKDIASWCPAYPTASRANREAFWVALISSLAWHESTHRPTAVGGGNLWYGLTQIYPDTARRYKCKAKTGEALKDPEDNLSCALRIMAVTVQRDQVVSQGMRGVAADWGPFHSQRKRNDMRAWTRKQSYCTAIGRSLRPVLRPDTLGQSVPATLAPVTPNLIRPNARPDKLAVQAQSNASSNG